MDNLTHSLTGLAMARAGLNRFSPQGTLILLISANIPDIDIVAALKGALQYLEIHRAYTHSLVGLPAMALLSVLFASALTWRLIPVGRAFLLACLGVASHLLLDWTNSYGIRLLLPWSSRWFHLDLNPLTDYVVLAVLLLAFVWPYFARLVGSEIGSRRSHGRGVAILALGFFLLFDGGRAVLHARSLAELNAVIYPDGDPIALAALPTPVSPFLWDGVVETSNALRVFEMNILHTFDPDSAETFPKLPRDLSIEAARSTAPFRYFEYFARFPVWSEQPGSVSGVRTTRVELTDLRFGRPQAGSFHCIALVGESHRVLRSLFTFGTGTDLGWADHR